MTRPDMPKKITFASRDRLSLVEDLAPRFFLEVLDLDNEECLITDESDLSDFTDIGSDHPAEVEGLLDRLEAHYHIDGRAAGSSRVVDLLEFLYSRGVTG